MEQAKNPLHGLTLEAIVTALVAHYGWAGLGERIPVRCFTSDPSIASSLKFLRKIVVSDRFQDLGNIKDGWAWYNGI